MSEEIENLIDEFNNGWTGKKSEKIGPLLHEKVVFVSPDFQNEIKGRDSCLKTIEEYTKTATTYAFDLINKKINVWNDTSVARLEYHVEYELNNQTFREKGVELWTLIHHQGNWKLVHRALVSSEAIK